MRIVGLFLWKILSYLMERTSEGQGLCVVRLQYFTLMAPVYSSPQTAPQRPTAQNRSG